MNLQQAGHPILVRLKLKLSMVDLSNIKPDLGLGIKKGGRCSGLSSDQLQVKKVFLQYAEKS